MMNCLVCAIFINMQRLSGCPQEQRLYNFKQKYVRVKNGRFPSLVNPVGRLASNRSAPPSRSLLNRYTLIYDAIFENV